MSKIPMFKKSFLVIYLCTCVFKVFAGDTIVYSRPSSLVTASNNFEIFDDHAKKYNHLTIQQANGFFQNKKESPVFSRLDVNIWARFSLLNHTSAQTLYFNIEHFNISIIKVYKVLNGKLERIYLDGNAIAHS